MGKVITGATMSLDGFIAGPGESGFEHLFAWYSSGDIEYPSTHPELSFKTSGANAKFLQELAGGTGACVVGRHLFDLTDGWGGIHPMNVPIVVLTHRVPEQWIAEHPGAPFTFVTEGIKAAVDAATRIAGEKNVAVNGGTMARQALEAGLVDELWVSVAPVLLGGGTPLIGQFEGAPLVLPDPEVIAGDRATHLRYRIR
ncbi:dihydrofolate reductase family protein [Nocardia huaxiensis]|uniref:Dihydrofolate reductase family protein n=1 Tax=Nocardia huaxiensis TaxID=2755382 RepID=A0A7D6Z8W9_9NOCA|nr:dihydrofolate reductase family protein [Nocardia huaxiensis]QLY27918.1 dihydrofolate reductase family protein [Nocardia huaxiensis]UFS98676.1 dihydrofolate reductase family protein [Nocardia huaxiensis]